MCTLVTLSVHRTTINSTVTAICLVCTTFGLFLLGYKCHRPEGLDSTVCARPVTVLAESSLTPWLILAALLMLVSGTYCCAMQTHRRTTKPPRVRTAAFFGVMWHFSFIGAIELAISCVFAISLTVLACVGAEEIGRIPQNDNDVKAVCYICPDNKQPVYLFCVYAPVFVNWVLFIASFVACATVDPRVSAYAPPRKSIRVVDDDVNMGESSDSDGSFDCSVDRIDLPQPQA